jgi:plastocyanin
MLAGCGSSSSVTPTSSAAAHATIKNFAFIPSTIHIRLSQTIEWTNEDAAPHNVTYVSGPEFRSSGAGLAGAVRLYLLVEAAWSMFISSEMYLFSALMRALIWSFMFVA